MTPANPRTKGRIERIFRRLDALAYEQLCVEAARLAAEKEELRTRLYLAEDAAERWRDDALRMMDELRASTGAQPGITQAGALVAVRVAH